VENEKWKIKKVKNEKRGKRWGKEREKRGLSG